MTDNKKTIKFLSLEDVLACGGADLEAAERDVERGFGLLRAGRINLPHKTTLKAAGAGHEHAAGLINFMPSYIDEGGHSIFACKAIGAMPENVARGLPRATGLITLFDPETKTPLCVMDTQVISATRTAAVTLCAMRRLGDAATEAAGLVGAGVNMRTQLLALKSAFPRLRRVSVFSRGVSKREFAAEMGPRTGLDILPVNTAQEAVQGKPLVVTCLPNMQSPVVREEWVRRGGVTVINIGCHECEIALLARMDRVVCDLWEHVKHRGVQTHAIAVARGVIPESKVEELGPILAGERPGRVGAGESIFFAPVGLGFQDALLAWRVYRAALERKLGAEVTLWNSPKWI